MTEDMHPQVAAMPRVRFHVGRDWLRDGVWKFGAYWDKNPWPRLGEMIYRKWFCVCFYLDKRT